MKVLWPNSYKHIHCTACKAWYMLDYTRTGYFELRYVRIRVVERHARMGYHRGLHWRFMSELVKRQLDLD
jgi:hypothetical protein